MGKGKPKKCPAVKILLNRVKAVHGVRKLINSLKVTENVQARNLSTNAVVRNTVDPAVGRRTPPTHLLLPLNPVMAVVFVIFVTASIMRTDVPL